MFELLITLGIYTVLVLFFVPLERIGKVQTHVKNHVGKLIKKVKD